MPHPGHFTPPRKDPVPILQEAGWAPGTVWTGAENLAPTGIRSPDRPVRTESLYRLSYPGPLTFSVPIQSSSSYLHYQLLSETVLHHVHVQSNPYLN